MRVLLTGHTGYIGSVMSGVLADAGHAVVGLDSEIFADCLLGAAPTPIPSLRKDLRDVTAKDIAGVEAVVHYGGLCNDPLGNLDPQLTADINLDASLRLARLARDNGARRFVMASSCSMYGSGAGDLELDESAPLVPLTVYAQSKVRTEEGLSRLADRDFSPIYMRNATVYGASPRLRADVVLNNLMCWAMTTGRLEILSDGTPWRPLLHVQDLAVTAEALLTAPREAIHDQAFNVGVVGENYQVHDLVKIVLETVPGSTAVYAGSGEPDRRSYRVDFTRLVKALPALELKWNARQGAAELREVLAKHLAASDFKGGRYTRLARLEQLRRSGRLDTSLRWVE